MAQINDLNTITEAFLATAVAALNLTDAKAPGRAYISPGEPALDCCGQVTVWIQDIGRTGLQSGQGALAPARAINRGDSLYVHLFVQATRCSIGLKALVKALEDGDVPNEADLQATAHMVEQDGWALDRHFAYDLKHGSLSQICKGAEMLGWSKLTPQGGCVGWTGQFRYPIEGGVLGP